MNVYSRLMVVMLAALYIIVYGAGCVSPRLGGATGGIWSYHCDKSDFSKGGEGGLDISTDMDDGWGLIGRFDIVGKLPEGFVSRQDGTESYLSNVFLGGFLDVTHTEVNNMDIGSTWLVKDDHHSHSKSSYSTHTVEHTVVSSRSNVEVQYQSVTFGPVIGYEFEYVRPYVSVGPTAFFIDMHGDYYGAAGESDTTVGVTTRVGAEVPINDNVYLFGEYRFLYVEPSLYYVHGSKFDLELEAHTFGFGVGGRF
jgi:opacity protein-like surface antigen